MIGRRGLSLLALIALVLVVSGALMEVSVPMPYVWMFSAWTILFLLAVPLFRKGGRTVSLTLALTFLVLFGFEVVLQVISMRKPEARHTEDYTAGYFSPDHPFLGYALVPDKVTANTKYAGDERLYSVSYTIGPDGLRVSPEPGKHVRGSVLFFGGSMTFGEGVEDEDALPYIVGVLTEGSYAIHNFALHGYGPHQMLSALEHGYVDDRVDHPPRYAIYISAIFHVDRIKGQAWDLNGPRYLLGVDGTVEHRGRFSDHRGGVEEAVRWLRGSINRSALGKKILKHIDRRSRRDKDLYLAILDASRRLIEEEYPGCEFHVIFWDNYGEEGVVEDMERLGLRVHRTTEIIPNLAHDHLSYQLHKRDSHPNPAANELIARYVVASILGGDTPGGSSPRH